MSSHKEEIGKLKKKLVTKTTDRSRPARVVLGKSLSSVWTRCSLKAHVRRCRSRWQLRCHANVSQKCRQTKTLCKAGATPLPQTKTLCKAGATPLPSISSFITGSVASDHSVSSTLNAVEENNSNLTKDECNSAPIISAVRDDNGPATDERVDSRMTADLCVSETVISDECVDNTGAVAENRRSTVTGECTVSEGVVSVSAVCDDSNVAAAGEEVRLNSIEEKNSSQEPLLSTSSSSSSSAAAAAAASVATEMTDVPSMPSAALSSSTHDVMVSLTNCFIVVYEMRLI